MLLHNMFEKITARYPENLAVRVPEMANGTITYRQLNERSNQLARKIKTQRPDSIVAILLSRTSYHIYMSQLAVLKSGAAYTCIDPTFPVDRIKFILEDSRAVALVTSSEHVGLIDQSLKENITIIDVSDDIDANSTRDVQSESTEENLAYVIYTSGTTGTPKGVMVEHRNIVNLVKSDIELFKLPSAYKIAQTSSTSYDSSVEEIWLAFSAGGALVVANDDVVKSGPDFGVWLRDEKINVLCPPPTLLRMGIANDPAKDLPDLKLLYVGGEPLPSDLVDKWAPALWMENGYGPTECSVTVTRTRVVANRPVTIGRPVSGNQAWVLDDDLLIVERGVQGELCISGAGVTRGYLNRQDLTDQKFIEHPVCGRIYRTGDLVSVDENGDLLYHGRIDLQVKIRGYRIELGDVEHGLKHCKNVLDAVCSTQEISGVKVLTAYLILQKNAVLDTKKIQEELIKFLPTYMVPQYYMCVEKLPTLSTSGKLDRKKLPLIEMASAHILAQEFVPPATELEKILANTISSVLKIETPISIESNFFEIGGDSLRAATVISILRENPLTSAVTVRELYLMPTVKLLAENILAKTGGLPRGKKSVAPSQNKSSHFAPITTVVQILWLLVVISAGSLFSYFSLFYFFPWILKAVGLIPFMFALPVVITVGRGLSLPYLMVIAIITKKILIGKYRPGRYPVWGLVYLKNWIIGQAFRMVPLGMVEGTVYKNIFLRKMGMKIGLNSYIQKGANVFIGGPDLLSIGDNVTIGREASVRTVDIVNGELIFGPVVLEDGVTLETRASVSPYTTMKKGSILTGLSMIPSGTTVPENEVWEGVPATFKEKSFGAKIVDTGAKELSPKQHGIYLMFMRSFVTFLTSIPLLVVSLFVVLWWDLKPEVIIDWPFYTSHEFDIFFNLCCFVVFAPIVILPTQAIIARKLGTIRPGTYPRYSKDYAKIWIKDRLVELAGNALSGTLLWPYWLRLAGMKIGKNCEISTIIDVVPELVTIGDEVFFADGIYLGGPKIHQNMVTCNRVELKENTFIGNHAIIPPGSILPKNILLGICTVADKDKITEGSSWFGHPAFELPQREIIECPLELTHNPSLARYLTRVFWEGMRFLIPIGPVLFMLVWTKLTYYFSADQSDFLFFVFTLPFLTFASLVIMSLLIVVQKWLLLGRVKPGTHPLWSCWCGRWDFLYVTWAVYARPFITMLEGTLLMSWWLRLMGAKVGKRVVLGVGFAQVVDPDMLNFEDYSTVLCMFQAHSFEDRVLKMAPIHIRKNSTIGNGSVLLYGANIGENAIVKDNSVVMKQEKLLPASYYIGCPTQEDYNHEDEWFT